MNQNLRNTDLICLEERWASSWLITGASFIKKLKLQSSFIISKAVLTFDWWKMLSTRNFAEAGSENPIFNLHTLWSINLKSAWIGSNILAKVRERERERETFGNKITAVVEEIKARQRGLFNWLNSWQTKPDTRLESGAQLHIVHKAHAKSPQAAIPQHNQRENHSGQN